MTMWRRSSSRTARRRSSGWLDCERGDRPGETYLGLRRQGYGDSNAGVAGLNLQLTVELTYAFAHAAEGGAVCLAVTAGYRGDGQSDAKEVDDETDDGELQIEAWYADA
jgi:hypothetical protein